MSLFDPILIQQSQIAAIGERMIALRDKLIGAPAIPQLDPTQQGTEVSVYSGVVGDLQNASINSRNALNALNATLADLEKAFG